MYILVDERISVATEYVAGFGEQGVSALGLRAEQFQAWLGATGSDDMAAVQGFVLGEYEERPRFTATIRSLTQAPIIVLNETRSLEQTLDLFTAGIDDVVRRPVHVREILARAAAIRRRANRSKGQPAPAQDKAGRLTIYSDGRDPEIDGQSLMLPRRERHNRHTMLQRALRRRDMPLRSIPPCWRAGRLGQSTQVRPEGELHFR